MLYVSHSKILQLLNHFCGTWCGFFFCAVTSLVTPLLKKMDSGAECTVRSWPLLDYNLKSLYLNLLTFLSLYTGIIIPRFTVALPWQPLSWLLVHYDLKSFVVIVGLPCCPFPGVASNPHPFPFHLPADRCNLSDLALPNVALPSA